MKYPIEKHAEIIFEKIKKETHLFESKIIKLLNKIYYLHLIDLPYIQINDNFSYLKIPNNISCIYFLTHDKKGLLYIGKSRNLRQRWSYVEDIRKNYPITKHHILDRALELKNVKLSWYIMNSSLSTVIESIVIRELNPEWNTVINKEHQA